MRGRKQNKDVGRVMRSDILLFGSGPATEAKLRWATAHRSVCLQTVQAMDEAVLQLERGGVDILVCDDEQSRLIWLDVLIYAARRDPAVVSIVTAHCPDAQTVIRAI